MNVTPVDKHNIRYLYREMIFAAIMAGIATFNAAFAIRLGASGQAIALLNALPALLMALVGIPSGRFLAGRLHRKWWFLGSLALSRLGYLVVALVPFVFPVAAGYWIVAALVVFALPLAFFQAGWNGFLGDLLPTSERVRVLSRRNVIFAVGLVAGSWLGGLWLASTPFPLNYSLLYGVGFLLTFVSDYYIARLVVLKTSETVAPVTRLSISLTPAMRRLLVNTFVFNLTWTLPLSLFALYFVNVLHLSDAWIGFLSGAAGLGVVMGYILTARLARQIGAMPVLRTASAFTWILPLILVITGNPLLILMAVFAANLAWAGVDLLAMTTTLDLSPASERTAYMGWYVAVQSAGCFLGPLISIGLGTLGYSAAFVIAALARIAAAGLFSLSGVKAHRFVETQSLVQEEVVSA